MMRAAINRLLLALWCAAGCAALLACSLEGLAVGDAATQLKARDKTNKLNQTGAPMAGAWFNMGEVVHVGVVHVCEGIWQAWACWQATGAAAVVFFGWAINREDYVTPCKVGRISTVTRYSLPPATIKAAAAIDADTRRQEVQAARYAAPGQSDLFAGMGVAHG